MTCSDCGRRTDDQPVITAYAHMDGLPAERFTGVVWCLDCAPSHSKQFVDDLEHVVREEAEADGLPAEGEK